MALVVRFDRALAVLGLGLLLAACGQPTDSPDSGPAPLPPGVQTYALGGRVLPPGEVAPQSLPTAAQTPRSPWAQRRARGQVLVLSAPGALSAQAVRALSGARTQTVAPGVTLAFTPPGEGDEAYAARLAAAGWRVQPNYLYEALAAPNDPGYPTNAGLRVDGAAARQTYLPRIGAPSAWEYLAPRAASLAPVTVAVLDTGLDRDHEDLAKVLPGRDFCSALTEQGQCSGTDEDPSEVAAGDVGHGTSSAGLIGAATNNGVGIAGVAWSGAGNAMLARLLPVKVFGDNAGSADPQSSAPTSALVQGLDYARAQGAKVVNMSLGFAGENADVALFEAIGRAARADIVMVASAGNTPNEGLYYPASDPRVLAVGALGTGSALACYSARPAEGQKALDLAAPGGVAGCGGGDNILTLAPNGYALRAGTSESAPQAAGVAALVRAYRPQLSADQVKAVLRASAQMVGTVPILDAGAAVRLAENPPQVTAYTATVRALDANGREVARASATGEGAGGAPYLLRLPAGTYTLRATLAGQFPASGSRDVTLEDADRLGVNVVTQAP